MYYSKLHVEIAHRHPYGINL